MSAVTTDNPGNREMAESAELPPPDSGRVVGWRLLVLRVAVLGAVLAIWEFGATALEMEFFTSKPSAVVEQLRVWAESGYLFDNFLVTVQEMLLALAIGSIGGIVVGMALGLSPLLSDILHPYIHAIYSVPKIALAPLFVLWFGIGISMKVALASVMVFMLTFFNTYTGVRERDAELMDVLRIMDARRSQVILKVVLPGALTYVFLGLKLAVPYSLMGAVVGELVASDRGLGFALMQAANSFNTAGTISILAVLMCMALLIDMVLKKSQARVLRWKGDE